jgi:hypothetical protein
MEASPGPFFGESSCGAGGVGRAVRVLAPWSLVYHHSRNWRKKTDMDNVVDNATKEAERTRATTSLTASGKLRKGRRKKRCHNCGTHKTHY